MRYFVTVGREKLELDVEQRADGGHQVRSADGQLLSVSLLAERPGARSLSIAGQVLEVQAKDGEVKLGLDRFSVHAVSEREHESAASTSNDSRGTRELRAPMPGRILRVSCAPGQAVTKGTALIVMEAMKMQNELCVQADHVVRAVHVTSGDSVERGAVLVELE